MKTTRNIRVTCHPKFDPERSRPEQFLFLYTYHILIENLGSETVQVLSRHWIIKDGLGNVEEVRGPGVVGEQPLLEPGQSFKYSSFCPLKTPSGTMEGSFQVITGSQEIFDVAIAQFRLQSPELMN